MTTEQYNRGIGHLREYVHRMLEGAQQAMEGSLDKLKQFWSSKFDSTGRHIEQQMGTLRDDVHALDRELLTLQHRTQNLDGKLDQLDTDVATTQQGVMALINVMQSTLGSASFAPVAHNTDFRQLQTNYHSGPETLPMQLPQASAA